MMFDYELFIVHAEADRAFVHGHLLPALGLAAERVLLSSGLPLGAPIASAIERGVRTSRLTVAVLTPAYMADRWAMFGEQLAGYANGVEGGLVPLLLADCEVPMHLDFLVALDFRDPSRWAAETQRLRDRLARPAPEVAELPCPYPGMRPYTAEHAAQLHGREAEIDEIVDRIRAGEREIYVIGPSGSGKSSLVAAGVLPRLTRGVSGLGKLLVRSLSPGDRPTQQLAQVLEGDLAAPVAALDALLARHAPAASLVLAIDPLGELFLRASDDERAGFLVTLRALRDDPRCVLVHVLRADWSGAFLDGALRADRQGRSSRVEVAPLQGAALRAAIERPARDLGVYFEPELVERLLADVGSEPGILPFLQEALVQLWDRRRLRLLTLADYQALGDAGRSGLAVAIARRADATLRTLTPAQAAIARRILVRLVSFGEGRADTRRQQPRAALRASEDAPAEFDAVLRRLIGDRLITIDREADHEDARVDLAHEAMIDAWPALADWTQRHRAGEQRRRRLEAAAAAWVERGCGPGGLLDDVELIDAEAWRRTEVARELGESLDVAALVVASRAALEDAARKRHEAHEELVASRRRLRHLLAQSYQEAGRRLVLDGDPLQALPYLEAARRQGEIGAPLRVLFWSATRHLPIARLVHLAPVLYAAFSPDRGRLVTTSWTTARVWDAATGAPVTPPLVHGGEVNSTTFSPDGNRVVTASRDGTARVWDAATGAPVAPPLVHDGAVTPRLGHGGAVNSAAFSADGRRVVTASADGTAAVWDAQTGAAIAPALRHDGPVCGAVFSPDGERIVTASADKTARVWDAATGEPVTAPLAHGDEVQSAAFSPDGARLVTASWDGTARVWDAATGTPVAPPLAHNVNVGGAVFSPDGTRVLTASADRTAQVWDAATGTPVTPPLVHGGRVNAASFSPDGSRIVTVSADRTARIWDAATGKPLTLPLTHDYRVNAAAFSPDGHRIVTAGWDNAARIWDVSVDARTLVEWSALVERHCPYALVDGVLLTRAPRTEPTGAEPETAAA